MAFFAVNKMDTTDGDLIVNKPVSISFFEERIELQIEKLSVITIANLSFNVWKTERKKAEETWTWSHAYEKIE